MNIEEELCRENYISSKRNIKIKIKISYTSPKGRNRYRANKVYDISNLKLALNQVEKNKKRRETKEYQRTLMTDSLRYDILRRDNFRCQLCGLSASDGVVLHVDHIIPVARGGKTTKSNLRALCERCNLGKGAKVE